MYKWLNIMGIVCLGFIVVLLVLGYLLKENKVEVTALKAKLEQEKLNTSEKMFSKAVLTFIDKKKDTQKFLNKQKGIIAKNLTCISSEQCTSVNSKLETLGCFVPINVIGASLLEKIIYKQMLSIESTNECEQSKEIRSICKQNLCQLIE